MLIRGPLGPLMRALMLLGALVLAGCAVALWLSRP